MLARVEQRIKELRNMNFILRDNSIRNNAIKFLMDLDISELYEVTVHLFKDSRSKAQNRLYWKWIPYLADYCGYTHNRMHKELKVKYIGVTSEEIAGVIITEPKSSKKLNVKEFANYLREVEEFANDYEVRLPHPEDLYNRAMMR